jgi:hypothetical protein
VTLISIQGLTDGCQQEKGCLQPELSQQTRSDGALPMTVRRAKRENGGLGEDPPGRTMTY